MILIGGNDPNPHKTIYYIIGVILNSLKDYNLNEISVLDLFILVRTKDKFATFSPFLLSLDCLYGMGFLELSSDGLIVFDPARE